MNTSLIVALESTGLHTKEARVYLALLELGRSKGHAVAQKTRLPRTTVYSILDTLIQKRLALTFEDKKIREYIAENPERIVERSQESARILRHSLSEMVQMFKHAGNRPRIRYFDGLDAIKEMHEDILRMKGLKDYQVIASEKGFLELDPAWFHHYSRKRAALGLRSRLILEESEEARDKQRDAAKINSEIRIMPSFFQERSNAGIYILPKIVVFIEYGKHPVAVEMESKELANMHRMMFEALWKTLPED